MCDYEAIAELASEAHAEIVSIWSRLNSKISKNVLDIYETLIEEGAILFINDPKVEAQQISEDLQIDENIKLSELEYEELINKEGNWCFEKDIYKGLENADAVVVLTEWNEYSHINWEIASNKLRKPGCVFDARSILNKEEVIKNDLKLWRIGDGYKLEK